MREHWTGLAVGNENTDLTVKRGDVSNPARTFGIPGMCQRHRVNPRDSLSRARRRWSVL